MGREGYWRWARRGRYRGIPLSNYAGWLVTGAAVMALLDYAQRQVGEDLEEPLVVGGKGLCGWKHRVGRESADETKELVPGDH